MARWASSSGSNADLREHMAVRAEENAARWMGMLGESAHLRRTVGAMADRWRSDEPMTVHGWELPATARPGIGPNATVTVHADGSLKVAERGTGGADVVELRAVPKAPDDE